MTMYIVKEQMTISVPGVTPLGNSTTTPLGTFICLLKVGGGPQGSSLDPTPVLPGTWQGGSTGCGDSACGDRLLPLPVRLFPVGRSLYLAKPHPFLLEKE